MKFGDNLKKLRKSQRLSQEELAEKMQVSRQSVSKWETGEAYPTMNNILELCRIFRCQINGLVNDNIIDLDSLDEEVRLNVVKFRREQQSRMKILSRTIATIARIARIFCFVAIPFVLIAMVISGVVITKVRLERDSLILDDGALIITETPEALFLTAQGRTIASLSDHSTIATLKTLFRDHSTAAIFCYVEIGFTVLILSLILVSILLHSLASLFDNINRGDTPFTLDNVKHIKTMAYLMIVVTISPSLMGAIFEIILKMDLNVGFELFNLVEILILFSIAYIFQYGYEIQLDSKGKMYGNTHE